MAQINTELSLFDEDLGKKPQVVGVNKSDLPDVQARWPEIEAQLKGHKIKPLFISAVAGTNVRQMLYQAAELLSNTPEPTKAAELPVYRPDSAPNAYQVDKVPEGWRVSGEAIERAAAMTYWEYDQSVRRFQRILEALGIDESLREAGVRNGDTVFIGEFELEWED
jgi:GTP-binding protein